jgi:hypothetical protein
MAAFGLPGAAEVPIILVVIGITAGLYIYPLWRLCERLGRPGALSLLYLVPLGLPVLLFMLAFGDPTPAAPRVAHRAPPDDEDGDLGGFE